MIKTNCDCNHYCIKSCGIQVDDIQTLRTIKLFANKVIHYQSGNIIGIVGDKNGFIDYVRDGVEYADIKLNVLIRGRHNDIFMKLIWW